MLSQIREISLEKSLAAEKQPFPSLQRAISDTKREIKRFFGERNWNQKGWDALPPSNKRNIIADIFSSVGIRSLDDLHMEIYEFYGGKERDGVITDEGLSDESFSKALDIVVKNIRLSK